MKMGFVQGQDHEISRAALHAQLCPYSPGYVWDMEAKGKGVKGQWSVLEEDMNE